jgi:hypothetical protein
MREKKVDSTGKKGGFFKLNLGVIKAMISIESSSGNKSPVSADEIIAYIVLSRGAGRFDSSEWTENAIFKYGSISRKRAAIACTQLVQRNVITLNPNYTPVTQRKKKSTRGQKTKSKLANSAKSAADSPHKYRLCHRQLFATDWIYLPNCFVDGVDGDAKIYPLSYFGEPMGNLEAGISSKTARFDALYLLLALYYYHDLEVHGGLPLDICGRHFMEVGDTHGLGGSLARTDLGDSGFCLQEVILGDDYLDTAEVESWFDDVSDITLRVRRIRFAYKKLLSAAFIYEVLQVWSDGVESEDGAPELQYPLAIRDPIQREAGEPALARHVNALAFSVYDRPQVFLRGEAICFDENAQFRFLGRSGNEYFLAGTMRLRYRPHDHDCGLGMKAQSNAVGAWSQVVDNLKRVAYTFIE